MSRFHSNARRLNAIEFPNEVGNCPADLIQGFTLICNVPAIALDRGVLVTQLPAAQDFVTGCLASESGGVSIDRRQAQRRSSRPASVLPHEKGGNFNEFC